MKTKKQIEDYLKEHWETSTTKELEAYLKLGERRIRHIARKVLKLPDKRFKGKEDSIPIETQIRHDRERITASQRDKQGKQKYDFLLAENTRLSKDLEAAIALKDNISPVLYQYRPSTKDTESIAVVLASDWHIEENVRPETVNGLNSFNMSIAKKRAEQFFQVTLRLIQIEQQATNIDTLVLALLGDFISGNIHEALLEICELEPIDAAIEAENIIIGGIQYLLDNSELKLIIPCHVGNHSRITKKVHIATETGNSMETFMYSHIKNHFRQNPRVEVLISPAYLSYLDVWGYTICFSHGHAVKYQGGIGGLTIPLRKAVNEWQENRRADLYCIGHWHQMLDIGEAMVNGSLCGYNSFAMFIKARFQRPCQTFFIINKKHKAKTVVRPVLFNC